MDFGLGRFLEMFEERFGRRASTALLILITLGLIAFIFPLVWKNLLLPIYGFSASIGKGYPFSFLTALTWSDVLAFISTLAVMCAVVAYLYVSLIQQFDPKYQIEMRRLSRLRERAMTGGRSIASRKTRNFRIALSVWSFTGLAALALVYAGIQSTKTNNRLALARQEQHEVIKQATYLSRKTREIETSQQKLDKYLPHVLLANEQLARAYDKLCAQIGTSDCRNTLHKILSEELKNVPRELQIAPKTPAKVDKL